MIDLRSDTITQSHADRRPTMAILVGIFVVAVLVRWPSCGESFWVDELHTAWCIRGTFDQVGDRAAIGNQQALYFVVLALWQVCLPTSVIGFYGTEAALRATSVLLTSVSAAWLVVIVRGSGNFELAEERELSGKSLASPVISARRSRHHSMLVGGTAAGLALSLDRDAIFFGTELRPYAAIVLLATASLALARWIIDSEEPCRGLCETGKKSVPAPLRVRDCALRVALHGIVLIAAATHVTSLIVLAPQLMMFAISDVWRHRDASQRSVSLMLTHVAAGIVWLTVAMAWLTSHAGLWQSRGNWDSFAMAHGWIDVWRMWPWGSLVILPIAGWAVACRVRGVPVRRAIRQRNVVMASLILSGVIGSMIACYCLSVYAGIPLWHRRYLIASLPLLCAVMGWFIGSMDVSGLVTASRRKTVPLLKYSLIITCLLLLTYHQGTLTKWSRGDQVLARRGENWRAAVSFVRERALDGDRVWMDAGLIEQQGQATLVSDPEMEAYLRYVTSGPYELGERAHPIGIGRGAIAAWLQPHVHGVSRGDAAPRFLITRRRSQRIDDLPSGIAAYRFGLVTVLLRQ